MANSAPYSFPKEERLCSQRLVDALFSEGRRLMVFPFSVRWMPCRAAELPAGVRVQVLVGTSKRRFRHAVDRNRVKRLTRECYRQQKSLLADPLAEGDAAVLLAVNYVHNAIMPYATLYGKMGKLLAAVARDARQANN